MRDVVVDIPESSSQLGIWFFRRYAATLEQPLQRSSRSQFQVGRDDLPVGDAPFVSGDGNLSGDVLEKILLARKDELYRRPAHLVCDLGKDPNILVFKSMSETSAGPLIAKDYLFWFEADRVRRDVLRKLRPLMAKPEFHPPVGNNSDAIERLQRLMCNIGCAILR